MGEKGRVPIEGKVGLMRDMASMAVISTDSRGLAEAKERKKQTLSRQARLDALEGEVRELKGVMKEMLGMLKHFVADRGEG